MPAAAPPHTSPLTLEETRRLARDFNLIPLARTLLADLETPVAAYLNCVRGAGSNYSYLLESVEGGEALGRYSYLGVGPELVLRQRGGRVSAAQAGPDGRLGAWQRREEELLEGARREVQRRRLAPLAGDGPGGLPPFVAGAVGYLGYDMARRFERLPRRTRDDLGMAEAVLMFFTRQVVFDHVRRRLLLIACVDVERARAAGDGGLEREHARALADLETMRRRLARRPRPPAGTPERGPMPLFPNLERAQFEAAVRRAQEYIAAGDIFQVVLSQRFDAMTAAPPFQVYRALRALNPSPYMYFLRCGELAAAGASPELLVQVREGRLLYRPIAGTRPRGVDAAQDERLERELLADEKERAEHVMLVDLGRNDVGRVAEVGSVGVERLMFVERYSHVMHLVSSIGARLRPGCDAFDALRACFPAGTLSGAPKVRAMEIIEELEPTRRGLYGGSVLSFDYAGNLDACIAIRTALLRRGRAHVQAGAGIVADSNPAREFEECVHKAGAVLRALEQARAGLEEA